jgi:hypothetical protein
MPVGTCSGPVLPRTGQAPLPEKPHAISVAALDTPLLFMYKVLTKNIS